MAGSHAQPGRPALPAGRPLGRRPRLPARRHAAGHRRRADGRGQAHPPRRGHRGHDAGPGRPEGRHPRRRHGPQELPPGGRRHREHERLPLRSRRDLRAVRRGRRRQLATDAGVPLLGEIPLESAVSAGGDDGTPVALGDGPAAEAFRAIADHIVEEAVPLTAMAGCSARMLDAAVAALDARDARTGPTPSPHPCRRLRRASAVDARPVGSSSRQVSVASGSSTRSAACSAARARAMS